MPLTTLDETPELDMTVDGADEIGPDLTLIKGGGGALLREKIVAAASARMVVIADESKWVPALGRFPLPVEVMPFGLAATRRAVEAAAAAAGCPGEAVLRRGKDGHAFVTDGGHWILDARLGRIPTPNRWPDGFRASPAWSSTVCSSGWRKPLFWPGQPASAWSSGHEPKEVLHDFSPTRPRSLRRRGTEPGACSGRGCAAKPTPAAAADGQGADRAQGRDQGVRPAMAGVIEYHKNFFMQINPNLAKDLEFGGAEARR